MESIGVKRHPDRGIEEMVWVQQRKGRIDQDKGRRQRKGFLDVKDAILAWAVRRRGEKGADDKDMDLDALATDPQTYSRNRLTVGQGVPAMRPSVMGRLWAQCVA